MDLREEQIVTEKFKADFLTDIRQLLEPGDPQGTAFICFLTRRRDQLKLQHLVDVSDIIGEATLRAFATIETNSEGITNPMSWMKSACLRILWERVKAEEQSKLALAMLEESYKDITLENTNALKNQDAIAELADDADDSLDALKTELGKICEDISNTSHRIAQNQAVTRQLAKETASGLSKLEALVSVL